MAIDVPTTDTSLASSQAAANGSSSTSMDLLLQLPLAAAFALLAALSLLQVLLPTPLSKQVCAMIRWATRNTVLLTMACTLAAGMGLAVAATAVQLRYLYLSNAPPASVTGPSTTTAPGSSSSRGSAMAATAGLSATASQGQQLWCTLLLGLSNLVLIVNIWGHAREQQQAATAKADSRAALRQADDLRQGAAASARMDAAPAGPAAGKAE